MNKNLLYAYLSLNRFLQLHYLYKDTLLYATNCSVLEARNSSSFVVWTDAVHSRYPETDRGPPSLAG